MDNEDFFVEDEDPSTTLQQLSKRRRPVKEVRGPRSKRVKTTTEESEDDLDRNVDFTYSSDEEARVSEEDSEEEKESAAEKRLRLAQTYLKKLSKQESDDKKIGRAHV